MGTRAKRCPVCGAVEDDPEVGFCAADGTPLEATSIYPPRPETLVGEEIAGRYRVVAPLGEGGMGTVYRAVQLGMDREVALKIIRADLAADSSLQARFEREARSASKVSSIRVVTLFDYGQTDEGLMFMAMELLDGESLADRLARQGTLAPGEAVGFAIEVARALEAAHELDVVHRDLKPDNVYITAREGTVKVLDFGIAKIMGEDRVAEDAPLTAAGAIIGTPMYMSPEACRARGKVGPASDLYSLGAMLFELLTGRPPFLEREPVLLLGMHIRARPPLLREVAPDLDIPDELELIVDQLLAKRPEERVASAAELADRLGALSLEGLPAAKATSTVPPGGLGRLGGDTGPLGGADPVTSPASRPVLPLLLGGLIVLVVLALGVTRPWADDAPGRSSEAAGVREPPETEEEVPEAVVAEQEPEVPPAGEVASSEEEEPAEEPDDEPPPAAPAPRPRQPRDSNPSAFRHVGVD